MILVDQERFRRLARERPDVIRRLLAFNFLPADYLHPSRRYVFTDVDISSEVWRQSRARKTLSSLILQQLKLEAKPCLDSGHWEWTVALLDMESMERLARHLGATILGPTIRRSVSRTEVMHWNDTITPAVYKFVMASASLLKTPQIDLAPLEEETPESIGYSWILRCLASGPEELVERAQLKLPFDTAAAETSTHIAREFVLSVLSALEPKWCSTFAKLRN